MRAKNAWRILHPVLMTFFLLVALEKMPARVSAAQNLQQPTALPTGIQEFLRSVSLKPLPETAYTVTGVVPEDTADTFIVNIPVPPALAAVAGTSTPFSAAVDHIYSYGDGSVFPCNGDAAQTAKNVTFVPLVIERNTPANQMSTSTAFQNGFACQYIAGTNAIVRCTKSFDKFDTSSRAINVNNIALIAIVPDCDSAKKFTEKVRAADSTADLAVNIILGIFIALFVIIFCLCLCCGCCFGRRVGPGNTNFNRDNDCCSTRGLLSLAALGFAFNWMFTSTGSRPPDSSSSEFPTNFDAPLSISRGAPSLAGPASILHATPRDFLGYTRVQQV